MLTNDNYCDIITYVNNEIYFIADCWKTYVFGHSGVSRFVGKQIWIYKLCYPFVFQMDFFISGRCIMKEKKLAVTAVVIDNLSAVQEVNAVLHEYNEIIIGRMGIPYRERGISMISVALDEEPDRISSLTGRLGQINGVSVKAAISKNKRRDL